jgi:hypothetical protein
MVDDTMADEELQELFTDIETAVLHAYEGLQFKMDEKIMNEGYKVPDDFVTKKELKQQKENKKREKLIKKQIEEEMKEEDDEEEYQEFKAEFELTYSKIMEPTGIICQNSLGQYEFLSLGSFTDKFSHRGKEYVKFVHRWWSDTTMRVYVRADVYAPSEVCPKEVFNLWTPYPYEGVVPVMTPDLLDDVRFVLDHVKILCDKDEIVYEYMLNWIAQFIQFPNVKTTMPVFASNEGAGKNIFVELLANLIGKKQVITTTSAEDIFGKFNTPIANHRLIVLNELSATELRQYDGQIKGLITDDSVVIQGKGQAHYTLRSMHRLIAFSNKTDHPIQTSESDRRKLIVRCSDEKIGNGEYFTRLYNCIHDKNVLAFLFTCFLKTDVTNFNQTKGRDIPKTEYQKIIVQNYGNVMEDWIHYIIQEYHVNQGMTKVEWTPAEQMTCFREFCNSTGVKLELTSKALGVRLTLYTRERKITAIESHKTNVCVKRIFHLSQL